MPPPRLQLQIMRIDNTNFPAGDCPAEHALNLLVGFDTRLELSNALLQERRKDVLRVCCLNAEQMFSCSFFRVDSIVHILRVRAGDSLARETIGKRPWRHASPKAPVHVTGLLRGNDGHRESEVIIVSWSCESRVVQVEVVGFSANCSLLRVWLCVANPSSLLPDRDASSQIKSTPPIVCRRGPSELPEHTIATILCLPGITERAT